MKTSKPETATTIGSCLLALASASMPALAAHPLQTEDTGTQGTGNIELENGLSWARAGASKVFTYQPQVSFGLTPELDLMVQPSWLHQDDLTGFGDTNLDLKWRFFGAAPWSFGIRSGLALATSEHGLGLPHGSTSTHHTLAATCEEAPWTFHANLGLEHLPATAGERQYVPRVSAAVMWAANEHLIWTMDTGASSDPAPHRHAWPATWLGGVIYTVMPSLDVDAGYQLSSAHAQPSTHQWLLGLTYRFAP